MQKISKYNKRVQLILCVIVIFSKCACVFYLKDKRSIMTTNTFQKILDKSNRKPNEIWINKTSELYNRSTTSWLQDNGRWTYVIEDLNGEEIVGTFYEKELQKINQTHFRVEKLKIKTGDKLNVTWKGYDNSLNRWICKKDIII